MTGTARREEVYKGRGGADKIEVEEGTEFIDKDIFGNPTSPKKQIVLNVYHDEREVPKRWLYHSFCLIPIDNEKRVLDTLYFHRKESTWGKKIDFHGLKDTHTENDLAKRWISYFGSKGFDDFYFYLLGIDLHLIEKRLWRSDIRDHRIYNRFFQIGLYSAMKWFFLNSTAGYSSVIINRIFSHERSREDKDEFHTRPIFETLQKSLDRGESITFNSYQIIEAALDHHKEPHNPTASHFIQFVDVVMGTLSQIYDATSRHEGKNLCANTLLRYKLPEKIMRVNPSSRYYKKYSVGFFPKDKIGERDFFDKTPKYFRASQFYNERPMAYTLKGQMTLFNTR